MLYLVGTPIGNLGDITLRALETLRSVDFVCAEDTRVTQKLLTHFDIKKPIISYFEHNKLEKGPVIIERLKNGENAALVSDAGMPGISDPGEHLVKLCIENGIDYTVVPGPIAFVTAAVLSGLSTESLLFEGFLPDNKKKAAEKIERIKKATQTTLIYEAPHNIIATLKILEKEIPERKIVLARELTKIYEETIRGTAGELLEYYNDPENRPRGEFVIAIEGAENLPEEPEKTSDEEIVSKINELIASGMKRNDAVKTVAKENNISRNDAYSIYEAAK